MGRGLELSTLEGANVYIICAGTGVLPFIDLINYLLLRSIIAVLKKSGKNTDGFKDLGVNFDGLEGVKIFFFGSFADEEEFLGKEIILKLVEINKKYNLNIFSIVLKQLKKVSNQDQYSSVTFHSGHFDSEFFKKHFQVQGDNYFVCGPPAFNQCVPKALKENGVYPERITLV